MVKKPWDVLPEAFITRVNELVGPAHAEDVLGSFCVAHPSTFRVNRLKMTPEALAIELHEKNIPFSRVPWYEDAFVLEEVPQKTLTETDLYSDGKLYVQGLSSMIPALVLDPKPGEKVLDLTAAPGSKTTQIAAMMDNEGMIVANDLSRARLYRLEANLNMQGVTIARVIHGPGELVWQTYPEYFDKVLVDVPCSLEGTFLASDPKSYRDWTPKKVKILAKVQHFLLRSAVSAAKLGGTIVYSTCTLEPEENEGVIDWILKREKGNVFVEDIALQITEMTAGLTEWKEKTFDPSIARTRRILPTPVMEGFFVARIKKIASTVRG